MRFFWNVLGTFATDVVSVTLNITLGVLTARILGPERRGILTLVMTLPITLAYFADLGLSQANVYMIGRDRRSESRMVANSVLFTLVITAAVGLGVWWGRDFALRTFLRGLPTHYLALTLALLPPSLLYRYWMAILRARQNFRLFNFLRLLIPLILLLLMAIALLVFRGGIGWAAVAYGLSTLIAMGIGLGVIGWMVRPRLTFDSSLVRASLRYGIKSYLQNLMGHLTYRLDLYVVAFFLSPVEVAFYGIATSVAELAWYVPNAVGTVLFPRLSIEEDWQMHLLTAEVCRHALFVTTVIAGGVILAGVVGIPLVYGLDYRPAIFPLMVLGPGIVAMAVYKVLTRNFSSRDRQQVSLVIAAVGLLLNGGLDSVLIPRWGTVGAAIASSCAYTGMGGMLLWAFQRESGLSWWAILRPRRSDLERYLVLCSWLGDRLTQKCRPWVGRPAMDETGKS